MAEKGISDASSSENESTECSENETKDCKEDQTKEENKVNKNEKQNDYSHPVYKNISQFNGEVNRMKRPEIIRRLTKYNMDTNGTTEILKRRLKNCYKKRKLNDVSISDSNASKFDYIVVIDYEATCEADVFNYRHEIIEFPAILVNVPNGELVDEFRSYCKPIENPKLTKFCTELTGITQDKVDTAEEFPVVLQKFEEWLKSHRLGGKRGFKFAVATDGPWDMRRFLYYQCQMSDLVFPKWARKWVNLRSLFGNFYKRERGNIENMLSHLGLVFEGRQHCGMDDTRNIARIAQHLIKDGCVIHVNQSFSGNDKGRIQEIKPQKNSRSNDFEIPEIKPVNIKTEADKVKDKEVREALRKLQLKEDEELVAFYKSINRY
ncbi:3'-5' exoribonuclease 1 [Patella vulgata]|uniref:3'-5' exoribonuclease 1 n=1 Tax=Patella vulgata TaxID=6465 RepID=UPI00218053A5|nr:3'-5' exoribonuclease 1 [Patella vulgata]